MGEALLEPSEGGMSGDCGQTGQPGAEWLVSGEPTELEEKKQRLSAQHPHFLVLWENGETLSCKLRL